MREILSWTALLVLLCLNSSARSYYFFRKGRNSLINPYKQCPLGYELHFSRDVGKYECRCKKYHVYWPEDGLCYREYQRGPCPEGHR